MYKMSVLSLPFSKLVLPWSKHSTTLSTKAVKFKKDRFANGWNFSKWTDDNVKQYFEMATKQVCFVVIDVMVYSYI